MAPATDAAPAQAESVAAAHGVSAKPSGGPGHWFSQAGPADLAGWPLPASWGDVAGRCHAAAAACCVGLACCWPQAGFGAVAALPAPLLAERDRDGLGATSSPFMTARHSFSLGSTARSSLFLSGYRGSVLGSIAILATKVMPSRSARPRSRRLAFASSLLSSGSRPSALSIMARNVRLLIFQPIEAPFSSTLPPETVKACQNLRRTNLPPVTGSSPSRLSTSLPAGVGALSRPLSI